MSEAKIGGGGALVVTCSCDRKCSCGANPGKTIEIKSKDMKPDMLKEATDTARAASEKHSVDKDVAEQIKKMFDKKYGPTWHCIVGEKFGSYVTHETSHFAYFYVGSKAVLLFKSG